MAESTLLERLPDEARVAVMLRADGWPYEEIACFMNITVRRVRFLLEQAVKSFPGILDHRRDDSSGRLMRLIYLTGFIDGRGEGQPLEEMNDSLDMLLERSRWLMVRMKNREDMERMMSGETTMNGRARGKA